MTAPRWLTDAVRPHVRFAVALACALHCVAAADIAQAQTFTLTPSAGTASTITTPTLAEYTSGNSVTTATWVMTTDCPTNIGGNNYCAITARLSSTATGTLGAIRVQFTLAGSDCKTAPGTFSITLTSTTATDLFEISRKGTNCTASNLRFTATDLTLTKYQSSSAAATFASNGIIFQGAIR